MRPLLHLTAPRGWVNDPHGITWHDGRYHVFHQAVPGSLSHTPACMWAHATSPDLLRFEHLPAALEPDADDDGIWTGCVVLGPGGARAFYTAVSLPGTEIGRVRAAVPVDETWVEWRKGEVVVTAPEELDLVAFRDPFVLPEADGWRMLVGAAAADGRALALTWVSRDLEDWRYDGIALQRAGEERRPVWLGTMWECPQVFELDGTWAMVTSVWSEHLLHHAGYALGDLREGRFDAAHWGRLTWGTYYAPTFFRDADGRPCLMLWMRDVGDAVEGWESCLSLPHVLSVRDGRLVSAPHPNVDAARAEALDLDEDLPSALDVEWRPGRAGHRLELRGDGAATALVLEDDALVVLAGERRWSVPVEGPVPGIRLVVDGPALEVWVEGRVLGAPVDPARRLRADGAVLAWALAPGD